MIRPTRFSGSGIDVWHDERGHGGTLTWNDIALNWQNRSVAIDCPVAGCNSTSYWPVSGGGDATAGQRLFIHKLMRAQGGRSWAQALAITRVGVQQQDGVDRWQLAGAVEDQ